MTSTSEDKVKLVDMSGPGPGWAQRKTPAASIKDGTASNASLAEAGGETAAEVPGGDSRSRSSSRSRSTSRSRDVEAKTSPRPWRHLLDRWRRAPPVPGQRQPCPEYEAGVFSKLTFSWVSPLITLGYRRILKANDIYLVSPARSVELHSATAEAIYKACVANGTRNPLFWALYTTFKRDFWITGICRLAADLFTVASPYTLRYLIQFVQDSYISQFFPDRAAPPIEHGIGLLVGILVMQILQSFTNNHFLYRGSLVGGQMHAILTTFIFEKSVRISGRARAGGKATGEEGQTADGPAADSEAEEPTKNKKEEGEEKKAKKEQGGKKKEPAGWNTGRVINLQAMDATRIDSCVAMIHMVWTAPLVILICMALLIVNLGYSALAGFACVTVIMAVLIKTVQVLMRRRANLNEFIDRRVDLIQETLQAIRLVKYLGWESSFLERLDKVRDEETAALQLYMTIRNVVTTLGQVLPILAAMFAFLTWSLTGHPISAAVVFSSMALFNCLRMPLNYLPVVLGLASEGWASLLRIQGYLAAEEVEKVKVDPQIDEAVVVRDASFTWEQTVQTGDAPALGVVSSGDQAARQPFQLRDVNFAVRRGELLAVIGGVASGKSSLLAALAGDMRRTAGSFVWGGSRALCTQTAWIQNATVRENILFGQDFDGDWYDRVICACALERDFDILAHGDATEIGERGINLSGGQKQRISLARAVYSRAEMLMLDDPLSAVDAYVGKHMFEQAICGLLAPCARILVTHHAHLWPKCDRILWLDEGRVVACDTYENLMANHPAFADMVRAADANEDDNNDPGKGEELVKKMGDGVEGERGESGGPITKTKTPMKRLAPKHSMPLAQKLPPKDELMKAEEQEVSSIPWSVYSSYIVSAKSPFLVLATLPLLCLAQGTNIMTGIWLASWSGDRYGLERDSYIAGYVSFAMSQPIFLYLFGLCAALWCTQASNTMVHRATHAVIHAPVSFFDSTPLGRIINRFSKDVDVMDFNLTEALRLFMISVSIILSIFILIIYYFHWFAAGLCGAVIIMALSAAYYRASGREIKRHESVLRSTVVARFSEGLSGVICIRTYGREEAFKHRVRTAVDDMHSATYLGLAAQRWLGFRLDYVGIMLIMTAGVLTLVERRSQNPAISGMVLSYTLGAVQVLQFIVRQWADVENAMNGTERLNSYENRLPQETTDDAVAVDSAWPPHGEVVFDNIHMRYRPGQPEVLHGFSLHVAAGEHIGIVGRTGAGKSSLIAALFRTTELSRGRIVIDGVETARVPLDGLRSNLAIVPQETTLFRGTVRSNLDPFNSYAEWALLDALSQADLASSLGLDDVIEEGGANLSLGQQQQLALARVLVRGNRIIVCDEATSNVDLQADDRLQATMAKAFKGRTVLTIAHRLRTILRYDRILVMDHGHIIELGTPTELYEGGGVFRGMCNKSNITKKDFL